MVVMKAGKCPSEALSLTNRVVLNSNDHMQLQQPKHIVIHFAGKSCPFTVEAEPSMASGQVTLLLFLVVLGLAQFYKPGKAD